MGNQRIEAVGESGVDYVVSRLLAIYERDTASCFDRFLGGDGLDRVQ